MAPIIVGDLRGGGGVMDLPGVVLTYSNQPCKKLLEMKGEGREKGKGVISG
jgi:hypothetical protein